MQRFPALYHHRNFSLRDEDARAFVASTGWALDPPVEDFTFAGDLLKSRDFILSRFWHPAARFTRAPLPHQRPGERLMILVVTEGKLTVGTRTTVNTVPEGGVLLARPESITHIENTVAVVCSLVILGGYSLANGVIVKTGTAAPDYLALFLTLTNAMLSRPVLPSEAAFNHAKRAVTELVAAMEVASDLRSEKEEHRPGDQIYIHAVALITAQSSDPATTVTAIARELGVSRSHLFRAFKTHDDSPSAHLRRVRVASATALLEQGVKEISAAEQSGFATVRRMRSALAER
ncbi:helix-turn-helix domain-containing protein [Microbacterium sp. 1.5R]|uniref:helix-turn-helix transcriptional regulator n=1 Tax=Microbacterium sp. 1.5R TaxID=1916917 RepID=UPI0016425C7C|nr:helix-turn-helix domain-containing protein [Microbacterium sp. 1.5R]